MSDLKISVLVLVTFVFSACCCKDSKRIGQDQAKAAAEAQKEKQLETKCGKAYTDHIWVGRCRDLVRGRLLNPSTSDFSIVLDVAQSQDDAKCTRLYSSSVTSKNAFGAEVKHRFTCKLESKKDKVTLQSLEIAR